MGTKNFKIVLLGDGGVGKTTLTNKFVTGLFSHDTKITIGVQFHLKKTNIEGIGDIALQIWDFGGEERFRFILDQYIKGANGILFLYSITDYNTLIHIYDWINIARKQNQNIPIVLVGAKSDLEQLRNVHEEDALEILEDLNLKDFIEVSAKTGNNVEMVFNLISKYIWEYLNESR